MEVILWLFLAVTAGLIGISGEQLGVGELALIGFVITQAPKLAKNELTLADLIAWPVAFVVATGLINPVIANIFAGSSVAYVASMILVMVIGIAVVLVRTLLGILPVLKHPMHQLSGA
jgi:hypothetical protein